MLAKSQVKDWKDNPVTQKFFEQLNEDRERIKEAVILGATTSESIDGTAQQLAKEIGKAEALLNILEYAVEDLVEEAVEDEDDDDD